MKTMTLRSLSILVLTCAVTFGCAGDLTIGDDHVYDADEMVILDGPFPATVEGKLEVASIQDMDGTDYWAFGWVETDEGSVYVYTTGTKLEASGADDGSCVRLKVQPSMEVDESYEIVEITQL